MKYLVYLLKAKTDDGYGWIIKKNIEELVDPKSVKFDGFLSTKQFMDKYGDYSDNFYICEGDDKYMEQRLLSKDEFDNMDKYLYYKN